jgi:hypothetical protein
MQTATPSTPPRVPLHISNVPLEDVEALKEHAARRGIGPDLSAIFRWAIHMAREHLDNGQPVAQPVAQNGA